MSLRLQASSAAPEPDPERWDQQLKDVFRGVHADELTAGDGDDRFEFGINVLVSGLAAVSEKYR